MAEVKRFQKKLFAHLTCSTFMVAGLSLLPCKLMAHPDRAFHYSDAARIMNGFGTPDYNDAMASVRRVAANDFSPNAAQSTIQSEKGFAGFGELFEQVSSRMDGMPRELEIKFGLKRGTLSHPKVHRLLGHGWSLDADPPEHILALFQKKTGIDKMELLNYWRNYQLETFSLAEKYTGLPASKAKAFAGLVWDIHLLGDWTPDNMEVSKLVPIKSLTDDFCKKIRILLGEGRRADYVCNKTFEFVESRIAKGTATRHIAEELRKNWLPDQKIGTEIYMANKESLKGVWNHAVAENINQANATIRTQKKLEAIVAEKELKHLAKEAKLKPKSAVSLPKEEVKPLKVVRDLKAQCKDAKLARGVIPETMNPQKGYLVPVNYTSGRKSCVLVMKSSAVKTGTEIATKDGTEAAVKAGVKGAAKAGTAVPSAAMAGAVEGVCAFVISSGIAFTMYQYGVIDDEELKDEFAKAAISGAVVGTAVAVSVVLGASPFGPVVIAVGIGGYVVCDIAFELMKGQPFTCDDILGYMDEEFEDTMSFFTAGTESAETFVDKKGKDSFVDEPVIHTFTDFGSKKKSFVDFVN